MEVEVCGEIWVAPSDDGSQGEDEPFVRTEGRRRKVFLD